jgi:hypothetical protein
MTFFLALTCNVIGNGQRHCKAGNKQPSYHFEEPRELTMAISIIIAIAIAVLTDILPVQQTLLDWIPDYWYVASQPVSQWYLGFLRALRNTK